MPQRKKILLAGSYHGNNLGDAAILGNMLSTLEGFNVTVTSKDGEKIAKILELNPNVSFINPFNIPKLLFQIIRSNSILIGGGGLFFDHSIFDTIVMFRKSQLQFWVILTVLAKLFRKKVFWVAVGAGPLRSVYGRWLFSFGLRLVDRASFRDINSLKLAQSIYGKTNAQKTSDIVYLRKSPEDVEQNHKVSNLKKVLLVLFDKYPKSEIIDLLEKLKQGYPEWLFSITTTNPHRDSEFVSEISKKADMNNLDSSSLSLEEFTEHLRNFDLIISMRMHALLLGAQEGIIGIGISKDLPKVAELQKEIYEDDLYFDRVDFEHMKEKIDYVLLNQNRLREQAIRNYKELYRLAGENIGF